MPPEISSDQIPNVAIIGRPNVGKSSLFNRLAGQRKAIIDQFAGTTRDRLYTLCEHKGMAFRVIDTGGIDMEKSSSISLAVQKQVDLAISESQLLLFVCAGKDGISSLDKELASRIRRTNKKILLVVNKIDSPAEESKAFEFYELGLGEPIAVSAQHNSGIVKLTAQIFANIEKIPSVAEDERIKIAIIGRPNAGKSSFINKLVQEERVIVDKTPGTTRDSIDTYFETDNEKFILIDTAGIRHKRKMKEVVEVFSFARSRESIRRSDGCLMIIDAKEGISVDDLKIIDTVINEGKSMVLCVNKWDIIKGAKQPEYESLLRYRAKFVNSIPLLFTSAVTGYNIYKSIGILSASIANASLRIDTGELNRVFSAMKSRRSPPHQRGISPNLLYIAQTGIKPPAFVIFTNRPDCVAESYLNYIEGQLRKKYNFSGTPIRFILRKK